jgi:hypothetical protein
MGVGLAAWLGWAAPGERFVSSSSVAALESRLARLRAIRNDGVLTAEEYDVMRRHVIETYER